MGALGKVLRKRRRQLRKEQRARRKWLAKQAQRNIEPAHLDIHLPAERGGEIHLRFSRNITRREAKSIVGTTLLASHHYCRRGWVRPLP
jgi:hypothetical protein